MAIATLGLAVEARYPRAAGGAKYAWQGTRRRRGGGGPPAGGGRGEKGVAGSPPAAGVAKYAWQGTRRRREWRNMRGRVAQRLEQWLHKPCVGGLDRPPAPR